MPWRRLLNGGMQKNLNRSYKTLDTVRDNAHFRGKTLNKILQENGEGEVCGLRPFFFCVQNV